MALYFKNSYSATATVSVAVLGYDQSCPNPWRKLGWYNAAPGQSVQVWHGTLQTPQTSMNWYFYAYASDGAYWAGADVTAVITKPAAFNQCWLDNSGDNVTVGMRHFDINGYDDYTVNLVPSSGIPFDNFSNFNEFSNFSNFNQFANFDQFDQFDNFDQFDDFGDDG